MFETKRLITRFDYDRIQNFLKRIDPHEHAIPIKKLKEKFKKAKVVDSKNIKSTIITMNSRFRLKNLGYGHNAEYALVFPDDSDPEHNKISIFDKLGSELLAHEVGDVIRLNNSENGYYLIENITYQPEAEGDYHL